MTTEILSRKTRWRGFAHLETIVFRRARTNGEIETVEREVADNGDGATILPYDAARGKITLIRQFRPVAFLNGGRESMVEACAGKLDGDDPIAGVRRETEEETGIRLADAPRRLFEAYSSPGLYAERLTYFVAPYSEADRVSPGGGLAAEHEDIEVFETTLPEALAMIETGEIVDLKTIALLYYAQATGLMDKA